jgi:transposase InsO family protein
VQADLVGRRFVADGPDPLWCTDITEHPTAEGKVYCAAVLDVFSHTLVGWSIADPQPSFTATAAFSTRPGSSATGCAALDCSTR